MMKNVFKYVLASGLFLLMSCQDQKRISVEVAPSHEIWDELVNEHVTKDGLVDYAGFISNQERMDEYLSVLRVNAPDPEQWTREERLAYWINAYNAFTVKLIMNNYPVGSIRDLAPALDIPGVNTVWHNKFFSIGGVETSLDEIEHGILRKEFDENRIHFAINCASISCPPLRSEAYVPEKLDSQLNDMAVKFINDPSRNKLSADNPRVSKIFSWFSEDFTQQETLIEFLNRYSRIKISENADIDYLEYDWSLNDSK